MREALAERTLEPTRGRADIVVVPQQTLPRLRGAAALVIAPALGSPVVA